MIKVFAHVALLILVSISWEKSADSDNENVYEGRMMRRIVATSLKDNCGGVLSGQESLITNPSQQSRPDYKYGSILYLTWDPSSFPNATNVIIQGSYACGFPEPLFLDVVVPNNGHYNVSVSPVPAGCVRPDFNYSQIAIIPDVNNADCTFGVAYFSSSQD